MKADTTVPPDSLEIRVRPDYVACAWQFAEKKGIRPYLQGVYFEPCPTGGVIVVATDGITLCVLLDTEGYASRPALVGFQKSLITNIKADARKRLHSQEAPDLNIESVQNVPWLNTVDMSPDPEVASDRVIYHVAEIDAKFPDWRAVSRIAPVEDDAEADRTVPLISAHIVRGAAKALDEVNWPVKPVLQYTFNGPDSPVIARSTAIGDGFFLFMPVKSDAVDRDRIAWHGLPAFAEIAA